MENDRIDFSALDPARDPKRWQRLIDSTTERALAARSHPLERQLAAWSRPTLAVVSALAIAAALLLALGRPLRETQAPRDPASSLAAWAATGEIPATNEVLQVLGESNE